MNQIESNQTKAIVNNGDLATLSDQFIAAQDVSGASRDTYRKGLERFLGWVRETSSAQLTREHILAYKRYLEQSGLASLTISSYMVTVRKFFEWTESIKLYPNVAKGIKGSKRVQGFRKDCLTVGQVHDVLDGIDRQDSVGRRDFALINLLVRTGLRTIEVIRANIGDIRQEGGEAVLWVQGKGHSAKDDFVLLTPDTLKPIRDYVSSRGAVSDEQPLFASMSRHNFDSRLTTRSVRRIVSEHLSRVGLSSSRLSAHSLRHTAITLSLQAGATVQEAQAMARHSNINTTIVYAHNISRLANAPERRIESILTKR